jgi:putative peptide zinc metalloprotease protein
MPQALTSSTAWPLALAMRRDLVVRQARWQGREYWIIKDPLALKYFRFEAEEFTILSLLDGRRSSDEVCEAFERQFAPQRITARQLQQLVGMLHRSQLLVASAAGQGAELAARAKTKQRRELWSKAANLLAIRFRGVDPDRFLNGLSGCAGWIFSLPAAACFVLLMLSATALVTAQLDTFLARLPTFEAFFAAENWLWLAVTLGLTKVLHELGHGLACQRFGGECHEMGVMLLVFTPCLYCNVSDAWMIPSKWRRIAVGAGGMYVELILASLATFGWWASAPGLFNALCLNVMFVSSVSTLLFNANPLMRFDGYYILADLVEIPNLRQKAATIVQRKLGRWLLGLRERPDPLLPASHHGLLAAYATASSIYGWLVSLSIFWIVYRALEPYGLKFAGQALGLAMVITLIVAPVVRLLTFVFQPARPKELNPMRAILSVSALGALACGVMCVPLPYYVPARFVIEPRGGTSVYVEVPGELRVSHVQHGPVAAGQTIAELDDLNARLAVQKLASQRTQAIARIEGIRQRAHVDEAALLELSQAEEALAALDVQLARLELDIAKLVIQAPASGLLLPAPSRPAEEQQGTLATWSGRPLEVRNVGAFLSAGTLLGRIAQPGELEAILAIPEEELDFVASGQAVDLILDSLPGQRLPGRIQRVSAENFQTDDEVGLPRQQPAQQPVVYQASVPLDDLSGAIVVGACGTARVQAGRQPLVTRLWRAACRTFHFEM